MKTMVQENAGYKLFAEAKELLIPAGTTHLIFTSCYEGAKDPYAERKICEFFLEKESVVRLKEILDN